MTPISTPKIAFKGIPREGSGGPTPPRSRRFQIFPYFLSVFHTFPPTKTCRAPTSRLRLEPAQSCRTGEPALPHGSSAHGPAGGCERDFPSAEPTCWWAQEPVPADLFLQAESTVSRPAPEGAPTHTRSSGQPLHLPAPDARRRACEPGLLAAAPAECWPRPSLPGLVPCARSAPLFSPTLVRRSGSPRFFPGSRVCDLGSPIRPCAQKGRMLSLMLSQNSEHSLDKGPSFSVFTGPTNFGAGPGHSWA